MSGITVKVKKQKELKRELKVSVPSSMVEAKKMKRFEEIAKTAKMPGFRPGKAPINIIQSQYGNQVNQETLSDVLESSYAEAITEKDLKPAGPPEVNIDQFVDGSDFQYTATIEVFPEFKLKGLDKIKLERPSATVKQSDINEMVENLQKQRGEWKSVDRNATDSDQLLIDFKGTLDGEVFEGGSSEDFVMQLGGGQMLPEFEEALKDVKPSDEKDFEVTFPDGYHQPDLSGKTANFNVKVKEVRELALAEVTEDFVKGFGIDSGKYDDLIKEISDSMEKEKDSKIKEQVRIGLMNYLREKNQIQIPEVMIKNEATAMQKDWMRRSGIEDESAAPELDNFNQIATERVHLGLLVNELVLSREMELDQERVKTKLAEITNAYPNGDEIKKMYEQTPELMDQLRSMVMEDQVVDWLIDKTTFTDKETEFKELINNQA
ncbi:MAG: trigger factor [Gammaproteobacteria bacterium]|nr:trigger factor [Gammaproteobacteria bacterium]OUT95364.1 MAG: trigger factor [Gammaproteobacteria bacterium TMED36]|tara:strand:+ start:311 stop:1615 length:1305 start_codon:yes stop_codon:yes gene_type:complete